MPPRLKTLPCFRDISLAPLDGLFDIRSPSGELAPRDFRIVLNMDVNEERKRCRMGGWTKLFSESQFGFLNQDLHDQLTFCQQYYIEYGATFSDPGGLTGYGYPYFQPDVTTPDTFDLSTYGPFCGYAPSFIPPYSANTGIHDAFFVFNDQTGYPYVTVSNPASPCNTGAPDFYVTPYFSVGFSQTIPGETTEGYSFGTPIGVYSQPESYDYTYCGTYLFTRDGCREAITLLAEIVTENGSRRLVAANKSRISMLSERTSNYRMIADGLGGGLNVQNDCVECPGRRFKAVTVGAVMVFTNNFDPLMFWAFDAGTEGCALWSAQYIQDLVEVGITKANVIAAWNGFVFLADVEQESVPHPTRIFWSDFNSPTSWLPTTESAAGFTDLGIGERILAMKPLGGGLRVYTDKAIYEGNLVGGDLVFKFTEIYRGGDSLQYPNSLVSVGDAHIYVGKSGIYRLDQYSRSPERTEWMHKASGVIFFGMPDKYVKDLDGLSAFSGINKEVCENLVGGWDEDEKSVWFSWPIGTDTCQSKSLKLNLRYQAATLVDHGFSSFLTFRSDTRPTVGDFLREWQICLYSEFGQDLVKEGQPYSSGVTSFPNPPSYIWNATEDADLPMHPDSLSARLGTLSIEDLCPPCEGELVFIMASAQDRTLKQYRPDLQYRERYVGSEISLPCPETVAGQYVFDGYMSLLQSDNQHYGQRVDKLIDRIAVDFVAEEQTEPNDLFLQIGYSAQPDCMIWNDPETRKLRCLTAKDEAQHEADNSRPDTWATYPLFRRGRYLTWRFYVNGTGGGACFNELTQHVKIASGEWR